SKTALVGEAVEAVGRRVLATTWKRRGRREPTERQPRERVQRIRDRQLAVVVIVASIRATKRHGEAPRREHREEERDRIGQVEEAIRVAVATPESIPGREERSNRARGRGAARMLAWIVASVPRDDAPPVLLAWIERAGFDERIRKIHERER